MDELQAGDKIVDLGAMLRSVTMATGAVSTGLLWLLAKQSGAVFLIGFVAGATSGLILGSIVSRLFYADGKGNVKVIKATPGNFSITLKVALQGAFVQTVFVLVVSGASGKIASWFVAVLVAVIVNLLIAFSIARLALS